MNFSVTNNRLKLSNGYDVSGSINTSSLLIGTSAGINPMSTLDVSGTANITGNFTVDTNTLFVDASNKYVGVGTTTPAYPLDVSGSAKITTIIDISNNVGSSGQVLSSTGNALSWIAPPVPSISTGYAVLREIQPAGTNSTVSFPNTTSNVRTLREINNIQFDNLGITISGSPNWTITIPTAGTYAFSGRAMFNITKVGGTPYTIAVNSKVFISDGTNENFIVGDSMTWNLGTSGTDTFNVNVDLTAVASITGSTTISFKQVCNPVFTGATQALTGGRAVNILSAPEVYATLQITKLS